MNERDLGIRLISRGDRKLKTQTFYPTIKDGKTNKTLKFTLLQTFLTYLYEPLLTRRTDGIYDVFHHRFTKLFMS